jgi:hypothetical protein
MEVKTVIETPEGAVEYTAMLSPEETKFILEYGLNVLMAKGAVPFTVMDEKDVATLHEMPESKH